MTGHTGVTPIEVAVNEAEAVGYDVADPGRAFLLGFLLGRLPTLDPDRIRLTVRLLRAR